MSAVDGGKKLSVHVLTAYERKPTYRIWHMRKGALFIGHKAFVAGLQGKEWLSVVCGAQ